MVLGDLGGILTRVLKRVLAVCSWVALRWPWGSLGGILGSCSGNVGESQGGLGECLGVS